METGDIRSTVSAISEIEGSFREYVELCARPLEHRIMRQYELKPNPSGDARTRQAVDRKRRQSQAELIDILRQECQVNQKNAFDLMQDCAKSFPTPRCSSRFRSSPTGLEKLQRRAF